MVKESKHLISNGSTSEDTAVTGQTLKVTESGTPFVLPAADIPVPTDGRASPQIGRSSNAFCTSSDDILNAFNFEDDQGADGYEQVNNVTSKDSPKVTLVCGDLFRRIGNNKTTLASILLEPQNKVLLNNFLEDFKGDRVVAPWVVGATLKHWASKLTLDEASESATGKLPYLKTTQTLTAKGDVDDPKALDRLEEKVVEYLKKLEEQDPYNQAVQSLGTIVNYICDTVDPTEESSTAEEDVDPNELTSSGPEDVRLACEDMLVQLREAEAEIEELQARIQRPVTREASDNKLLHRIAGFDAYMGIAEQSEYSAATNTIVSRTHIQPGNLNRSQVIFPMVFPTNSSMLSAGFRTPSKLSTIGSKHQLESKVSLTLLASTSSRHGVQLTTIDDNGNPVVGHVGSRTQTDIAGEDSNKNKIPEGYCSKTGEDIADEIVMQMWKEDPNIFELASVLERNVEAEGEDSVSQLPLVSDLPTASIEAVSLPEVDATGESEKEVGASHKSPPIKKAGKGKGASKPMATVRSASKEVTKSSGTKNDNSKPKVKNLKSRSPSNDARKKTVAPAPPVKNASIPTTSRPGGSTTKTVKPAQRSRPMKPPTAVAFGVTVDSHQKKPQTPGVTKPITNNTPGTSKKLSLQSTPRKVEPTKVAPGCRRIEFTKVTQTVSYRQLNKENLELLKNPVGHSTRQITGVPTPTAADGKVGLDNLPGAIEYSPTSASGSPLASPGAEAAQPIDVKYNPANLNLPRAEEPGTSSKLTTVFKAGNLKNLNSTPSSGQSSRIPSLTSMKSVSGNSSKARLGYAELSRHKKCLQGSIANKSTTPVRTSDTRPPPALDSPATETPLRFK